MSSKASLVPFRYREMYNEYTGVCAENVLRLIDIWEDCGVKSSQIDQRMTTLFDWFRERWSAIIQDELQSVEQKRQRITQAARDLENLSKTLEVTAPVKPTGLNLQQQSEWFDSALASLEQVKVSRLKQIEELKHAQKIILEKMSDVSPYPLPDGDQLPSEDQLRQFTTHVQLIRKERRVRLDELEPILRVACDLMHRIGKIPDKDFEDEIFSTAVDDWDLSKANIRLAAETLKSLELEEFQLIENFNSVRNSLEKLFHRLEVSPEQKAEILDSLDDPTYQNLRRLQAIEQEYEELKRENLSGYIDRLKAEARSCWQTLRTGSELEDLPGEPSEELANRYELLIAGMKERSSNLQPLFKLVDDKQNLIELLRDLEESQKDPNRFRNRGGGLLQETKKRERVTKNLPIVVRQIIKFLDDFEPHHGIVIIDGSSVRDEVLPLLEKRVRLNSGQNSNLSSVGPASARTPNRPSAALRRAGTFANVKQQKPNMTDVSKTNNGKPLPRHLPLKSPSNNFRKQMSTAKKQLRRSTSYGDFETIMTTSSSRSASKVMPPSVRDPSKIGHTKLMF